MDEFTFTFSIERKEQAEALYFSLIRAYKELKIRAKLSINEVEGFVLFRPSKLVKMRVILLSKNVKLKRAELIADQLNRAIFYATTKDRLDMMKSGEGWREFEG